MKSSDLEFFSPDPPSFLSISSSRIAHIKHVCWMSAMLRPHPASFPWSNEEFAMLSFSKNFPAFLQPLASAMHDKALKAENDAKVGLILRLTSESRMDSVWNGL